MNKSKIGLNSTALHILAMSLMLLDHLWATIFPYCEWMTCVGRVAYPIFAFLVAEGAVHTHDRKKYLLRMVLFAIISEVPFNLLTISYWTNVFHQNVLWSFALAILFIMLIDLIRTKVSFLPLRVLLITLSVLLSYVAGLVTFVDYYQIAVPSVLVFYLFREKKLRNVLIWIAALILLNGSTKYGLAGYGYDVNLFGRIVFLPQQAFAVLSIIPILLYNGEKGYRAKWFQYFCYAFYPVHMIVIYIIWQFVN